MWVVEVQPQRVAGLAGQAFRLSLHKKSKSCGELCPSLNFTLFPFNSRTLHSLQLILEERYGIQYRVYSLFCCIYALQLIHRR